MRLAAQLDTSWEKKAFIIPTACYKIKMNQYFVWRGGKIKRRS